MKYWRAARHSILNSFSSRSQDRQVMFSVARGTFSVRATETFPVGNVRQGPFDRSFLSLPLSRVDLLKVSCFKRRKTDSIAVDSLIHFLAARGDVRSPSVGAIFAHDLTGEEKEERARSNGGRTGQEEDGMHE